MFAAGIYKQDVYMNMSYVNALIWKGIYSLWFLSILLSAVSLITL